MMAPGMLEHLEHWVLQSAPKMTSSSSTMWLPIRYFVLAFELGRQPNEDAIRERFRDLYDPPSHIHALLVPDSCVIGHRNAMANPEQEGDVWIGTANPIAVFRARILESLSTFPTAPANSVVNLHQYFAERPEE